MFERKDTGTPISSQHLSVKSIVEWIKAAEFKPRHKLLLRFLADYYAAFKGRICPSIRKLAAQCGVSRQAIHRWLNELESLGAIRRVASYRHNGGRTSNLYYFAAESLQGDVIKSEHQEYQGRNSNKHDAKHDVAIKDSRRKRSHLKPDDMRKGETAAKHYRLAVENRWISSSENERFGFFTLWSSAVRRYREGTVKNPGSWFTAMLKRDLHLKIGTQDDERTASKVLNNMRLQSA